MDWRRIPSLSALRAFEAAARRGSFTQAAEELNVTQAAVTQHVRGLENELSEVLVVRKGRGIEVTPKGRHFAESLREGFSLIADGVETVRAHGESRPLRLSTSPGFATHWLMPRLGDFWARHPEIDISITPSVDLVDLRRDGFDVAIRYGDGRWPGNQVELLTDGDFWVVAHPDLIGDRQASCLEDVADFTWLLEEQMQEGRVVESGDRRAIFRHARTRHSIASPFQSKSLVEDDVRGGTLCRICALRHENYGYYIVTKPGREVHGFRPFRSWLRGQVKASQQPQAIRPV